MLTVVFCNLLLCSLWHCWLLHVNLLQIFIYIHIYTHIYEHMHYCIIWIYCNSITIFLLVKLWLISVFIITNNAVLNILVCILMQIGSFPPFSHSSKTTSSQCMTYSALVDNAAWCSRRVCQFKVLLKMCKCCYCSSVLPTVYSYTS